MLPKKKRVTKNVFQAIMEKGNVVSGSFFIFRYIKQENPQYAFVVSKKIAKNAVKRNLLRRRGYNILRFYNLKCNAGVFFFKKEGFVASPAQTKNDIEIILKKAHII